ncbi:MAG: DUF4251 domain-containing protein [Mangrovibacterium sp.]
MKKLLLILIVACVGISSVNAQKISRKERKALQEQQIKELVDSGKFTFEARSAQPMSGRQIDLTSLYTLSLNGDSIEAYLPYFGRAYTAPYGGDGGIKFNTLMKTNTKSYDEKKKMHKYEIEVLTDKDKYSLIFNVGSTGYANLTVNCNNRQPISFLGRIQPKESE